MTFVESVRIDTDLLDVSRRTGPLALVEGESHLSAGIAVIRGGAILTGQLDLSVLGDSELQSAMRALAELVRARATAILEKD